VDAGPWLAGPVFLLGSSKGNPLWPIDLALEGEEARERLAETGREAKLERGLEPNSLSPSFPSFSFPFEYLFFSSPSFPSSFSFSFSLPFSPSFPSNEEGAKGAAVVVVEVSLVVPLKVSPEVDG
jgi:hypothetical protein